MTVCADRGRRAAAAALLVLGLLAGCSSLRVGADWDRAADFTPLRTWDWISSAPGSARGDERASNPLLQRRIESAVQTELAARGYRKVEGEEPDFRVAYHLGIDRKIDVQTVYRGYPSMPYRGVYGPETLVREYDVGSLLIDVIREQPREVIWRGWAQARLQPDGDADPVERDERAREAVARILERFPPGR